MNTKPHRASILERYQGRNFIKEIRAEQRLKNAIRVPVKSLSTENKITIKNA